MSKIEEPSYPAPYKPALPEYEQPQGRYAYVDIDISSKGTISGTFWRDRAITPQTIMGLRPQEKKKKIKDCEIKR